MENELTPLDISTLLTSLEASKKSVRESKSYPEGTEGSNLRSAKLGELDAVAQKLRGMRDSGAKAGG